jgi:cystathionine beta-lyase/cystathionine gamma-synthase
MDKNSAYGLLGTMFSFTLDTVHLAAATVCALLTAIHMGVSIYQKVKGKGDKE